MALVVVVGDAEFPEATETPQERDGRCAHPCMGSEVPLQCGFARAKSPCCAFPRVHFNPPVDLNTDCIALGENTCNEEWIRVA